MSATGRLWSLLRFTLTELTRRQMNRTDANSNQNNKLAHESSEVFWPLHPVGLSSIKLFPRSRIDDPDFHQSRLKEYIALHKIGT